LFNIVLYKPEIPPNTGNISRLCVGVGASLHIVGTPAFDISEKAVKRAGLDYWNDLDLVLHSDWDSFLKTVPNPERIFLITKFGKTLYSRVQFQKSDYLVFGSETSGLPESVKENSPESNKLYLPMLAISRSINLSNTVAVLVYEGIRQIGLK
jgi:tRNA (cytidine/uridine-2'-O-)-methyltransferase